MKYWEYLGEKLILERKGVELVLIRTNSKNIYVVPLTSSVQGHFEVIQVSKCPVILKHWTVDGSRVKFGIYGLLAVHILGSTLSHPVYSLGMKEYLCKFTSVTAGIKQIPTVFGPLVDFKLCFVLLHSNATVIVRASIVHRHPSVKPDFTRNRQVD